MQTAASRSVILLLSLSIGAALPAQDRATNGSTPDQILAQERYVRPPAEVERLVLAPRHLNVTLTNQSPSRRHFLKVHTDGMPTVTQFGKPWYNLAGVQIDPRASRARTLTTRAGTGFEIIDALTGRSTTVEIPSGARVTGAQWSPDGTQLAFFANFDAVTHVYVADVATGKSRQMTDAPVLATLVTEPEWASAGREIVTVMIPENRGAEPKAPAIAVGPKVRMTKAGTRARTRTYADLLEWPHERDLLEYYTTGQLVAIDVRTRAVRKIGAPAMIQRVSAAPTGGWLRVALMQKPFSHIVPVSSFGSVDQIWDATGKSVVELSRRALREGDQGGDDDDADARAAADTSRRNIEWMPNGDGITFLQSERPAGATDTPEEGTQGQRSRTRDRLHQWSAPFDASRRKVLLESSNRMSEVAFSADAKTVFVAENASGTAHVYAVELSDPAKRLTITRVRGLQASLGVGGGGPGGGGGGGRGRGGADSLTFYQNPGTLISARGTGARTVLTSADGRFAYLAGVQHYRTFSDSAPQPFLDRVEIRTGQKTRLFTSAPDQFEQVIAALDPDFQTAIVTRESPTAVPDSYRRDMKSGVLAKLTNNRDYTPEMTSAQRQMFQVTRPDGYRFWVNVTLPRDWKTGTRIPAFIWFYPYEFTDQAGYDRTKRTYNRNRFPNLNALSKQYLITQGYAVVEPDAPIVGEQGRMNDNYVSDLRNNLSAVIDELDRRGIADRQRMGIGGHSYGAFSTVNAMVHTPFFKAGIAGDGNYNRTLTPNSFQSERRALWEARETYLSMSPILYADRLTGALLMYHNLEDQNVGTDPINSVRLFHALQGMGKAAALYMHPYEDHGPATRETVLDLWGRWTAWLDKYLKGAKPDGKIAND
jgi:dipeptidyl aminopeptidase/acylaminoacyl peptidase